MSTTRVYLDHAATAPMRQEALDAFVEASGLLNPAGQYASGRAARAVVEQAREDIARVLGADPVEVVFTGSGTEANNIAVVGLALGSRKQDPRRNVVVAAGFEHPSVLESVKFLTDLGFTHRDIPVDAQGRIDANDPGWVEPALLDTGTSAEIAVATCMWANNETGAIQPIEALAQRCTQADRPVPLHVDAVQVAGYVPIDFHHLGVATMAMSAHKFGGPKSAGILLARRDASLLSPVRGGGQERGLRSGTVNPAQAAATAAALNAAVAERDKEVARISRLRDALLEQVLQIPDARVWTSEPALPGHLHVSFPGAEGDSLIMLLDAAGFDASTGSACSAGVNRASHVLQAMGVDTTVARGALRITLGSANTDRDVAALSAVLPKIVEQARTAGMAI